MQNIFYYIVLLSSGEREVRNLCSIEIFVFNPRVNRCLDSRKAVRETWEAGNQVVAAAAVARAGRRVPLVQPEQFGKGTEGILARQWAPEEEVAVDESKVVAAEHQVDIVHRSNPAEESVELADDGSIRLW